VIVGVAGLVGTTIVGPLIQHHIQKDRESQDDVRRTLDAATEPLVAVTGLLALTTSKLFDDRVPEAERAALLDQLQTQVYLVESHVLKLSMRFGAQSLLVQAYGAAGGARAKQAEYLWDRREGLIKQFSEYEQRMNEAEAVYDAAYESFIQEARKFHEDSGWPYLPAANSRMPAAAGREGGR
jgi:hypothetical protein